MSAHDLRHTLFVRRLVVCQTLAGLFVMVVVASGNGERLTGKNRQIEHRQAPVRVFTGR